MLQWVLGSVQATGMAQRTHDTFSGFNGIRSQLREVLRRQWCSRQVWSIFLADKVEGKGAAGWANSVSKDTKG